MRTTRLVCRSGSPIDIDDVGLVNIAEARSVVLLSGKTGDADSSVVKTPARGLEERTGRGNGEGRRGGASRMNPSSSPPRSPREGRLYPYWWTVSSPASWPRPAGSRASPMSMWNSSISRVRRSTSRTLRTSSARPSHETVLGYESSAVIGLVSADGKAMVNPPMQTLVGGSWKVIAVAEDDDKVIPLDTPPSWKESAHQHGPGRQGAQGALPRPRLE